MSLNRLRIQNKIVDAALTGRFYPIRYSADDKSGEYAVDAGSFDEDHRQVAPYGAEVPFTDDSPEDSLKRVSPASCSCNETSATFDTSGTTALRFNSRRTSWEFQLRLAFDVEVSVEGFETDCADTPLFLPRDTTNALAQVFIKLKSTRYNHPARQEPQQGTRVVFTFEATISP